MNFQPGDVVRLKSGGPNMTIESIDNKEHTACCVWFAEFEFKEAKKIPFVALESVQEG